MQRGVFAPTASYLIKTVGGIAGEFKWVDPEDLGAGRFE